MLSFFNFITEASIRQGLPHITTMDHEQFSGLTHGGKVHLGSMTEKTDGMTHLMGHDEHGFYTQSSGSGSEKMRSPQDYIDRATRRAKETGKPLDLTAAKAFGHVHSLLHKNENLQNYLKSEYQKRGETKIRGEVFYRPLSRPSEEHKGEVKFVGTSYDPSHMGSVGKYVLHTKLPENEHHSGEHFKKQFSTPEMNFDTDTIEHKPTHVDVSKELEGMKHVDRGLLAQRTTKTNKAAKQAEQQKFETVKKAVSDKVDAHIKSLGIRPKWGTGTEGVVVHPKKGSKAPRFKVTSDAMREYKANPENKMKFKQRNQ